MKISQKINFLPALGLVGIFVLFFSFAIFALAQENTVGEDIPDTLVPVARELGCNNKAECAIAFDQNFNDAVQIAIKYNAYKNDPEKQNLANTYQNEVLTRLTNTDSNNLEEEIIKIAKELIVKKPSLAKDLGVSKNSIQAADSILSEVKKENINLNVCQKPEDELSVVELRACLKAARRLADNKVVTDFIPTDRFERVRTVDIDKFMSLDDALKNGEYSQLGRISAEEAGLRCLRVGSESLTDCNKIAEKFFGPEGVKELARAHAGINQIQESYDNNVDNTTLRLPSGQEIVGRNAIKNECDKAFNSGDLIIARVCGEMAVRVGLSTKEDMERGLQTLDSFSTKSSGRDINFEECRFNPRACEDFMPDNFRDQYKIEQQIFDIMSLFIGFDPAQCENNTDPTVGLQCVKGAQAALPKIRELATNSPKAQRIVAEVERHVSEAGRMADRVREVFDPSLLLGKNGKDPSQNSSFTGPGGCSTPQTCFQYCSDSANSAACVSFGAQQNIFQGNDAVERFQKVTDTLSSFNFRQQGNTPGSFSRGQFNQPNQFNQQPGQFNQPNQFNQPTSQQQNGPSPACFNAIRTGNFELARTACQEFTPPPITEGTQQPYPVCPQSIPSSCPEGQYRRETTTYNGCPSFGSCMPIPGYQPQDNPSRTDSICPSLPTVSECGAGQTKVVTFSSPQCGEFFTCQNNLPQTVLSSSTACAQAGGTWNSTTNFCQMPNQPNTPVQTVGSCNYSTQYWKASTSQCQPRTNCYDTNNSEYNSQECQGVRGSTAVSYGCGSLTTQTTCQASPGCGWANGACGGNTLTNTSTGQCPSGQYWYTPPSGGAGYCMTTSNTACTSGQYWYVPPEGGTGYCRSSTTYSSDPATACAQAGGAWNVSSNFCNIPNTTPVQTVGSCDYSTQYWKASTSQCMSKSLCTDTASAEYNSQECMGVRGQTTTSTSSTNTTNTTCSSGQYWYTPPGGGTGYCQSSTIYSNDPATGCTQAGGTWSSATNFCQMPNMNSGTACPSGQYWNGLACVANTTGYIPSPSFAMLCDKDGGVWTGGACDLSGVTKSRIARQSNNGSNLAAQVISFFGSLFSNKQ